METFKSKPFIRNNEFIDRYSISNSPERKSSSAQIKFVKQSKLGSFLNSNQTDNINNNENLLRFKKIFYENEALSECEGEKIEFKRYRYPLDKEAIFIILKTVNAFLNHKGGRIYFGVNDDGVVKGMNLNSKEKDDFLNLLLNITKEIQPQIRLTHIKIYAYPVYEQRSSIYGPGIKDNIKPNLFVIKMIVKKGDYKTFYSNSYDSLIVYKRSLAQNIRLNSCEINSEIMYRFSNVESNKIYDDFEDDDCEYSTHNRIVENNYNSAVNPYHPNSRKGESQNKYRRDERKSYWNEISDANYDQNGDNNNRFEDEETTATSETQKIREDFKKDYLDPLRNSYKILNHNEIKNLRNVKSVNKKRNAAREQDKLDDMNNYVPLVNINYDIKKNYHSIHNYNNEPSSKTKKVIDLDNSQEINTIENKKKIKTSTNDINSFFFLSSDEIDDITIDEYDENDTINNEEKHENLSKENKNKYNYSGNYNSSLKLSQKDIEEKKKLLRVDLNENNVDNREEISLNTFLGKKKVDNTQQPLNKSILENKKTVERANAFKEKLNEIRNISKNNTNNNKVIEKKSENKRLIRSHRKSNINAVINLDDDEESSSIGLNTNFTESDALNINNTNSLKYEHCSSKNNAKENLKNINSNWVEVADLELSIED